jgi:mannose-1-phosphate guanylyltransferase
MLLLASNPNHGSARAAEQAAPLCGLVLAGGDGQRLMSFIRPLRGDPLPKQYVKFTGVHSMLEQTYRRAEKLIPRERLFTVANHAHMKYPAVVDQIGERHPGTVLCNPTIATRAGLAASFDAYLQTLCERDCAVFRRSISGKKIA